MIIIVIFDHQYLSLFYHDHIDQCCQYQHCQWIRIIIRLTNDLQELQLPECPAVPQERAGRHQVVTSILILIIVIAIIMPLISIIAISIELFLVASRLLT